MLGIEHRRPAAQEYQMPSASITEPSSHGEAETACAATDDIAAVRMDSFDAACLRRFSNERKFTDVTACLQMPKRRLGLRHRERLRWQRETFRHVRICQSLDERPQPIVILNRKLTQIERKVLNIWPKLLRRFRIDSIPPTELNKAPGGRCDGE
ncbi:MAG: hypothetical protein AAFV29_10715 [Myxococcota bacterium]